MVIVKWLAVFVLVAIGIGLTLNWPLPGLTARDAVGVKHVIKHEGRTLSYYERGMGYARVVLFASAGREASDFNELVVTLNDAGYRTLAFEAQGIGDTDLARGPDVSLAALAGDVLAMLDHDDDQVGVQPTIMIGHAFGNRVTRTVAHLAPERIAAVALIAAGGPRPIAPKAATALKNCFNPLLPRWQRADAVRYGFFADGNIVPDHWMRGWHLQTALQQGGASANMPDFDWLKAGGRPMLVLQADSDTIAPPEDAGLLLKSELGDQVTLVMVPDAGHALLPEQPDLIAREVLAFLSVHATKHHKNPTY